LTVFGKIFIGDILFANAAEKAHCRTDHAEDWDEDEQDHYHVFEDLRRRVCDHLAVSFLKLSYCAGVVIVENYHECLEHFGKTCEKTLQFREVRGNPGEPLKRVYFRRQVWYNTFISEERKSNALPEHHRRAVHR
jgi:hypothetical protein